MKRIDAGVDIFFCELFVAINKASLKLSVFSQFLKSEF